MKINGLLMDDKDNVVTCVADIAAGSQILYQKQGESYALTAQENIPDCHKAALVDLPCGAKVIKYGEVIGETLCLIPKGYLVNHENLISIPRDYDSEFICREEGGENYAVLGV